MPSRDIVPSF